MPTFADLDSHPDVDDFVMTDAGICVGPTGNPSGVGVVWPYRDGKLVVLSSTEVRSLAYHLLKAADPKSDDRYLALAPSKLGEHRRKVQATRKRRAAQREALKIHGIA